MDIAAIALGGMNEAQGRVESAARRLASAAEPTDTVDLSAEMVALMEARNAFTTNARVLETADEIQKNVIDILG